MNFYLTAAAFFIGNRLIGLTVIFFVALTSPGYAMENDHFLSEIAAVPRVAGTDKVNISHVVVNHFKAGDLLSTARTKLEKSGFKVISYAGKEVPSGQQWLVAQREDRVRVVLSERTRVIIKSDGRSILSAEGWVFLIGI